MSPLASTTTPLPSTPPATPVAPVVSVWITTSDGSIAWYTCCEKAGPGV